jgi:2,3-bisphosphoglycerate-dependent phosphoglycerate mutase
MSLLTLIRHGQSTYNLQNRFTGNIDVPLSSLGMEEAKTAGKKLIDFNYQIAYTSTLIRAQETLRIMLVEMKQTTLPIIENAALNERMYGDLQGLDKTQTTEKYGAAQVEIWRRSYEVRPPGGESLEDTFNRTVPYFQKEILPQLLDNQSILLVAHGNSLRALMMFLEKISPEKIAKVEIATGVPKHYRFGTQIERI